MSIAFAVAVMALSSSAQQPTSRATLDSSETLFSTLAAISHCGYAGNSGIDLRREILSDMANAVAASDQAKEDSRQICQFYLDHRQAAPAQDLAQYISLALEMGDEPKFDLKVKEADLPPDATYVLGFRPLLINFAHSVGLHEIWTRHQYQYSTILDAFHTPVTNTLQATDVYLRLPMSGFASRNFYVFVQPMLGSGPVNARNYGIDYYLVTSPQNGQAAIDAIRHTYLHYVIDPLVGRRATAMKRIQPILPLLVSAPLDDSYKHDTTLLVSESLIRAIEARLTGKGAKDEAVRENMVDEDMAEGFVLARYFYGQLIQFEKGELGFQDALGDFFYNLDVDQLKKRVAQQTFTSRATPEVLASTAPGPLQQAEQRFAAGDYDAAKELATQALNANGGDPGRALFLLGQIASMMKDMQGAENDFTRAATTSKDPHVVAWSHIYLGRIDDIKQEREAALAHYNAALLAGDPQPQTKAAAERGLKQAYAPPTPRKESD